MSFADFLSGSSGGAQPGAQARPHGFAGYLDSFLNPQNTLGQFGRALVEAGGTPLGDAFRYMDENKRQSSNDALDRQYKQAQIAHLSAGPAPDQLTQRMIAGGIDPHSPEGIKMYAMAARHEADPIMTNVVHDEDPNTHTITDRLVGVPYSQIYGATSPLGMDQPPAAQPTPGALAPPQAAPGALAPPQAAQGGNLLPAVIAQESGGNYRAIGPQTAYGRAQGGAQMLPQTAQGEAAKLGMPWKPELMTDTSPDGVAYQNKLAQGYLDEGMAATGNQRDALRYYHGGPNRNLWGPKTNAYADQVMGRVGGASSAPNRAALIADAQAAIARGADPAKVAARLQQMGVQ